MKIKERIIMATPLIATIVFLTIGFTTGVWHPTWAVFFSILVVPELLNKNFYLKLYPIVVLATYLTLGFTLGIWHPLWIIFLTIPVYYIFFSPVLKKRTRCERKEVGKVEIIDEED